MGREPVRVLGDHTSVPRVVELDVEATYPLRRSVLRTGTAITDVRFDDDDRAGTVHLGITVDARVVAISTWIPRPYPDEPDSTGVQLRGMATDPSMRGAGHGTLLLSAGLDRWRGDGVELVWARARDTALDFYLRHRFSTRGHGYTDLTTGLPHHDVIRRLDDRPVQPADDLERDDGSTT